MKNCSPVRLPSPSDKLWLITDACSANTGIAATLLTSDIKGSQPSLSSFFSAKLKPGHKKWLPCEIECLAIATSINHFRPFILESENTTSVLTDSRPCVQAYQKFMRGEFSTSSRMQAFLLAATQNNINISHIKGSNNLLTDFGSRNSVTCDNSQCSVCKFIDDSEHVAVNSISVADIVKGNIKVPFSSMPAWLQIQLNCSNIQLTRKHLQQGTRPLKKQRNIKEVRQLLRSASVTKDGLVVVSKKSPLQPDSELIVIPQSYAPGLLMALHLQLNHPTTFQLQKVFDRQFFTTNAEKLIKATTDNCHECVSLQKFASIEIPFSTSAPYDHVGSNFSADVLRRTSQKILVITEEVTKFTKGKLIDTEDYTSVLNGLKELLNHYRSPCSPCATLKLDPGPSMQSLHKHQPLKSMNVIIDLGEAKNKNKLATIDKQIQELENELTRIVHHNAKVLPNDLSQAIAVLNSRIRYCGLSSYEQWHRRSQFNQKEINISDDKLIKDQASSRDNGKHKAPTLNSPIFQKGSLVCIRNERTKHQARPRYIIDRVDGSWLFLHKLTDTQLRSKVYKVHRNACISLPHVNSEGPLRKKPLPTSSDSESDSESSNSESENVIINSPGGESSETPGSSTPSSETAGPSAPPSEQVSHQDRYFHPVRDRKPPPWLKDYAQ